MQVPPRDVKKDKLTSFKLLFYSYVFAGFIQTLACFMVYFRIFGFYGVSAHDLFTNNNRYFPASSESDRFQTSDGRNYSLAEQAKILAVVQGAWYLMIVTSQAAHVFVCRTTTMSIFQHGVFSNKYTNWGVLLAIGMGCLVVYTPGIQEIVTARDPMQLEILYASLAGGAAIWIATELRKWYTRSYPESWWNVHVLAW
jgi:magnesium-transporting ATPase (P-type)